MQLQIISMKKLFSTRPSETTFSFGVLLLRLGSGLLMIVNHGYMKMTHFNEMAGKFGDPFHIGSSATLGLVVFAEFFCAGLVVLGLFTRLAAMVLIVEMLWAFFEVHKGNYASPPVGGEMAVIFLTAFVTLLFTGAGKFSVDRFIAR